MVTIELINIKSMCLEILQIIKQVKFQRHKDTKSNKKD